MSEQCPARAVEPILTFDDEEIIPESRLPEGELRAWFEERLIEILYAVDSGEDVKGIDIGSPGAGTFDDELPEITARINELTEALGVSSQRWSEDALSAEAAGEDYFNYEDLNNAYIRHLVLKGTSIGEYFAINAFDKLPIEQREDDRVHSVIALKLPGGYVLYLRATGSVEFGYPRYEDEDTERDPITSFELSYSADVVRGKTVPA